MCYKYRDSQSVTSYVNITCDAGRIIIVKSAVIGVTSSLDISQQCPIANDCLNEFTPVAELCTGRNSCDIDGNFLFNVSQTLCFPTKNPSLNSIKINYTCIVPGMII